MARQGVLLVFCPKSGKNEVANRSGKYDINGAQHTNNLGRAVCTKCGGLDHKKIGE